MMRFLFVLSVLAEIFHSGSANALTKFEKVSFYFSAHEDDWQLFMNPPAYYDVTDHNTKSVFVHVTAGDAGLGIGTGGRKHPYYLARENGARAAIRFMADVDNQPVDAVVSRVNLKGHRVFRVGYRNTVAYFFRLPDGNPKGTGYQNTGFQSLERFMAGKVKSLAAIDSSSEFSNWKDFTGTVRALIDAERGSALDVQLNFAELDNARNPGDHSDHLTTARAALEATQDLACARRVYYTDYATADLPENLSAIDKDIKSAVFGVTAAGITSLNHANPWDDLHRSWLGRGYSRSEEGRGRCDK